MGTEENSSEKGGSGSFVVSTLLKELVGVLLGGLTSREATFVTPIEAVKEDIFEITGTKLVP